jgi:hypothetical protein
MLSGRKDSAPADVVIEGSYIVRIFCLISCVLHERPNRETMMGAGSCGARRGCRRNKLGVST